MMCGLHVVVTAILQFGTFQLFRAYARQHAASLTLHYHLLGFLLASLCSTPSHSKHFLAECINSPSPQALWVPPCLPVL